MKKCVKTTEVIDATRVLVCGGRDANIDETSVDACISDVISDYDNVEFVSGGARGGDKLGETFAKQHGYPVVQFKPDWNKYGRAAGPIRNTQMIDYIQESTNPIVIAFWDGKSRGTRNTIETAQSRDILVHIIRYSEDSQSVEAGIALENGEIVYDWQKDNTYDILPLVKQRTVKSTKNGHIFFYAFKANKTNEEWSRFLDAVKHGADKNKIKELTDYLANQLYATYNNFDMILYPKSSSIINETLVESIHEIDPFIPAYDISKSDVKTIKFDWNKFNEKFSGDDAKYEKNRKSIERMMDRIHKSDKFSMQKQVIPRFRKYVTDFLELEDLDDALEDIVNSVSILILDDIVTTGSTVTEIINMLNNIGFEGDIVIYSLINNR